VAIGALSPCRQSGCRVLVLKPGYCDQHRKETFRKQKQKAAFDYKERNRFYQRVDWKKARAAHLQSEPLCRSCRAIGKLVAAIIVDHIVQIEHGGAPLDDANLQSMCKPCHNSKTRTEQHTPWGV